MLNMSTAPYNDDFDPNKNFHRILFKPEVAVQARELTQAQTILQDQISKFASSIFSQNTPISGGKITTNLRCEYIKLNAQYLSVSINVNDFLNKIITDSSRTILARVLAVVEATGQTANAGDPPTLIVSYLSGVTFSDNMNIFPTDGSNFAATSIGITGGTTCTGLSSIASISAGVFYVVNGYNISNIPNADGSFSKYSIGNFVSVLQQTTILDKYGASPSYRVGLQINETIIDYIDDPSLLDSAIGASSYQAPGADRYEISLTLTTFPLTVGNDDSFIELLRIENGTIVKQVDSTVYSTIDDYFAKRTFDTNGDYIVNQFKLTPATNLADSSKYDLGISKGVAYVRGYRLENQSSIKLTGNRARSFETANNVNISVDYGNFLFVNSVVGSYSGIFDITIMPSIDLHSVSINDIVSTDLNSYNSTKVGTALIRNLDYDHFSNTSANTNSYVYKTYICNVQTNTLTSTADVGTTINTIQLYDPFGQFSTKNNAYIGVTLSIISGNSVNDTRTITAYNGSTKTATVNSNFSLIPTNSTFILRFGTKDIESLVVANTSFGLVASAQVDNSSKTGNLAAGSTILQDVGFPELLFNVGNPYLKDLNGATFQSKNHFRNKAFNVVSGGVECQIQFDTVDINVLDFNGRTNVVLSSTEILNYFTVFVRDRGSNLGLTNGQILDFTAATRTVIVATNRNVVTFFASDLSAATLFTVDVVAKVFVTNADDTNHIMKTKSLITANQNVASNTNGTVVNANTYVDLTNAQVYIQKGGILPSGIKQSLYISDVKRIIKIIDTGDASVLPSTSMFSSTIYDVSANFNLSNGQTDNYYDHASITQKPGTPRSKGNLLVLLDYYNHSGGDGYFCIKSYLNSVKPESYIEIPNYLATNGSIYPLRDCLDFRPSRVNASNTFVFRFTNSDIINTDTGFYFPDNLSSFNTNYSYYLPRKDLLILTKDKNFQLVEGVSSQNPIFPAQPDGSLLIGKLTLDPFTGYIPGENPVGTLPNLSFETIQHKRWTMQDISDLQTRINNIEYYTALNALEQKAASTQIPDVNGLGRFKNGILVDDFSSFSTADTSNIDWSSSINKRTRQLSAEQTVLNFPLQNPLIVNGLRRLQSGITDYAVSTVNGTTNIFTLPYISANVIVQQLASNTINLNPFSVVIHQGTLQLNPPMDNWVDNTKAPALLITDPSLQIFQQSDKVNVLSTGDWKVVPGTTYTRTVSKSTSTNQINHGAFNGPFGNIIGTTQLNTVQTSLTYGSTAQTNTLGNYQKVDNTYSVNNNFITDITILPYIRAQDIGVRAEGMLMNTPITCSFDGINVDKYMISADVVELANTSGTFNTNDVIGYHDSNVFYPVGRVIGVHNYEQGKTRLHITGNFNTNYFTLANVAFPTISSVDYDSNGNPRDIALGISTKKNIINAHLAGKLSAVGGNFIDVASNSIKYYRVTPSSVFGNFAAKYGIWGSPKSTGHLPAGKFNVTAINAGTHYLRFCVYRHQTGYIKINGSTVFIIAPTTFLPYSDLPITLSAGINTIEFSCTNGTDDGYAFFGVAISTSPWSGSETQSSSDGVIIFSTDAIIKPTIPDSVGTQIGFPGIPIGITHTSGLYHTNVTKVSLSGIASDIDDFYTGGIINFNTSNISRDNLGFLLPIDIEYHSSKILSYSGTTKECVLETPVNISQGFNQVIKADTTSTYSITGLNPAILSTDATGTFAAIFRVPQSTFKTGDRVFRVDNRTTPNDPSSATTFAEATFTASGLSTKSQQLDFGVSIDGAAGTFTHTDYQSKQLIGLSIRSTVTYSPYDPVAQSFIIDKQTFPNGLFLTSVDFFFQSKPTLVNSPVTLTLVPTINGYPGGKVLDYSTVTLKSDAVNISATPHYLDNNTKTTFKFPAPVYIQSGILYAFILKSPSTDYNIYLAAQNATAIVSTAKINPTDPTPTIITKIGSVPSTGGLFESQNGMTWTADQSKTLMMVINRCLFDITKTPVIPFGVSKNLPTRKSSSDDLSSFIDPNNVSTITNQIIATDIVYDAFNVTTTDLTPTSTGISYTYSTTLASNYGGTSSSAVSPGQYACPTYDDIYLFDGLGERILVSNSVNSFNLSSIMVSSDNALTPMISDDGLSLFTVKWNINNLNLSNAQIIIANSGFGYNTGTPNANVTISAPDLSGGLQAFAVANVANGIVDAVYITNGGSGYLQTPIVTITGTNTYSAIANVVSEFSPYGGNAKCKYFTKKVVMAAGNDSKDLRIFYTAYKPQGTDILVFCKLLNGNDPTRFDDNNWILLTTIGQNKNVFSKTRDDLFEFEAAPGTLGVADNFIIYTNKSGQSYDSFIQFAIKVVMISNDSTAVPFLTDIRAMALPSGTGA